jgi:hypothetical protein
MPLFAKTYALPLPEGIRDNTGNVEPLQPFRSGRHRVQESAQFDELRSVNGPQAGHADDGKRPSRRWKSISN